MFREFLLILLTSFVNAKYTPDWESLDSRPLPEWYDKAKIGIFMHFGPYAVPGLRTEWFWQNWVHNVPEVVNFMKDNYPPHFTYQDFGPQLTMEFFDPQWFADLVTASGAKYLVFTSKHHDGFVNFNSSYSFGWNSMSVGPKRNVMKDLKDAFKAKDPEFHFGLYYSLFEWYNPLYLNDKKANYQTREFVKNKMIPEMKELAKLIEPHVWWSDGDWETKPEYFTSQEFLAWLFNESPSKDQVVVNDRWGQGIRQKHGSFFSGPDKWQPGALIKHKWESCMTIDKNSWGIRRNIKIEDVLTPQELISQVAMTVSFGGNILINVGPTKEGTIIPVFEERLRQLGSWLKVNGEAIYETTPWVYQNDTNAQDPQVWYTTKQNTTVYAIVLGWPKSDQPLELGSVESTDQTEIIMLGLNQNVQSFEQTHKGLKIRLPPFSMLYQACYSCQWATVLKMSNVIPSAMKKFSPKIELL